MTVTATVTEWGMTATVTTTGTATTDATLSPSAATTDLSVEFGAATKYRRRTTARAVRHPAARLVAFDGSSAINDVTRSQPKPFAAPQYFSSYWGHSGQWPDLTRNALVVNDPIKRHCLCTAATVLKPVSAPIEVLV
jgi:hypothetical protein